MAMTSIKHPGTNAPNLRPVDVLNDMPTILDLIETGFEGELDPQGWKMLKQMRKVTRQAGLVRMRSALSSESKGYVWVEDGQVVANLSLRIAVPSVTRGRLIGNVVVHPDYRGRGIGHALVEQAVQTARREGARWIGLEVRQQNKIACDIYQHFGFRTVGSVYHMLRQSCLSWPGNMTHNLPWRKSKPQDKTRWLRLAETVYGNNQKRVLEIRANQYAFGGFDRWINLWLNAQRESAWIDDHVNSRYAVCAKTDRRDHFHVWKLIMHGDENEVVADEMVAKAFSVTKKFPSWTIIALVADQPALFTAMQRANFHIHRTLLQMMLEI